MFGLASGRISKLACWLGTHQGKKVLAPVALSELTWFSVPNLLQQSNQGCNNLWVYNFISNVLSSTLKMFCKNEHFFGNIQMITEKNSNFALFYAFRGRICQRTGQDLLILLRVLPSHTKDGQRSKVKSQRLEGRSKVKGQKSKAWRTVKSQRSASPQPSPEGKGAGIQGSRFKFQVSRFRFQGSGLRVQVSSFRVQGSGFRFQLSRIGELENFSFIKSFHSVGDLEEVLRQFSNSQILD